ncbi:IclR family transcriptional regulator [Streptomyces sp. NEAU-H3]|uniref:IclR family transcriptional regulator n=1 Tax=Streptomyces sp. NEAU-H3 TaxID=2720636 RepID=UPI00143AD6AA|nr:IclR family transcriptional regulator [Streptomyces sp. NEAU-H3]NJA55642.1 IclR family transcriptional regulator [Streptomyces sp. NEAU-H3]
MPTPSTSDAVAPPKSAVAGGVQSLERAFDLLERMADAGGEVGLSELATSSGLPLPTIHRLMRTLVSTGYVRQQENRRYALGPRLIRLGESASVLPHSTGVGKALLADSTPGEVRALLARTGMPAATDRTLTTPESFLAALDEVRARGFAVDDNEQEIGVRCLAVSVPHSPTTAALSVSGPAGRLTDEAMVRHVPVLRQVAAELSEALARRAEQG